MRLYNTLSLSPLSPSMQVQISTPPLPLRGKLRYTSKLAFLAIGAAA